MLDTGYQVTPVTDSMASFVAAHKARYLGTPAHAFGYSNGATILASVAMLHPLIPWAPAPVTALKGNPC